MLKISIIFAMLLCAIGAEAQEKKNSNTGRKLELVRGRTGVDSLTGTRIVAIEQVYKASVSLLMQKNGMEQKNLHLQIDELIRVKNAELSRLLPRAKLLAYLPSSERIQLEPAYAADYRSRQVKQMSVHGNKITDTVGVTPMALRKKGVHEIAASYDATIEQLREIKLDASSKAIEIKKLEAERDEKIVKFLSGQTHIKKDKQN